MFNRKSVQSWIIVDSQLKIALFEFDVTAISLTIFQENLFKTYSLTQCFSGKP